MDRIRLLPVVLSVLVIAALLGVRFFAMEGVRPRNRTAPVVAPIPEPAEALAAALRPVVNPVDEPARDAAKKIAPPVVAPVEPTPAAIADPSTKWEQAYSNDFSDEKHVKSCYTMVFGSPLGDVLWYEKYKAMLLRNNSVRGEVYALVHKALPGDVRVRVKAMCRKEESEVSLAFLFSIGGAVRTEDGYFAEWAGGRVQLKRRNQLVLDADAPTPKTDSRWVNLELRREGARIRMYLEGAQVLDWTDDQPIADAQHDLFGFYVWSTMTLVKDLVIERNAGDPIKPLADDPATDDNILRSIRNGAASEPEIHDF